MNSSQDGDLENNNVFSNYMDVLRTMSLRKNKETLQGFNPISPESTTRGRLMQYGTVNPGRG
ncbi:hypothetical protein [Pleomorphovibrio marinus]|uniref:hypothetical protein n=1 Tax=Pleomorphovibrio marinus TaxID=2164132 RepID=UPI000E0ACF8C|nr:hypothetical protein [Pleomorphovibrio marinus]